MLAVVVMFVFGIYTLLPLNFHGLQFFKRLCDIVREVVGMIQEVCSRRGRWYAGRRMRELESAVGIQAEESLSQASL